MTLAVFCIYAVDFAINGGKCLLWEEMSRQSGSDGLPTQCRRPVAASSWILFRNLSSNWAQPGVSAIYLSALDLFPTLRKAGRMLGLGHVLGYLVGTINLSNYVGTRLGTSQFKEICVIAGVAIVFCVSVTSFCVEERVLLSQR